MPITRINSDVAVTVGPALSIASGDRAFVNEFASLSTTDINHSAIAMAGTSSLTLNGLAFGEIGLRWTDAGTKSIQIGTRGAIDGGSTAISGTNTSGTSALTLVNRGEISSHNVTSTAIIATISLSGVSLNLTNSGQISAAGSSYTAISVTGNFGTSSLTNSGTITGDVTLSKIGATTADLYLKNTGLIDGDIYTYGFRYISADISGRIAGNVQLNASNVAVNAQDATLGATLVIDGETASVRLQDSSLRNIFFYNTGMANLTSMQGSSANRIFAAWSEQADFDLSGGTITGDVETGSGADIISLFNGRARGIFTNADTDTVTLGQGAWVATVDLGAGHDTLTASEATTIINFNAGDGDDVILLNGANINGTVNLGLGNDRLVATAGASLGPILGDEGNDTIILTGALTQGRIQLGAGNDTFEGSNGRDSVSGGTGDDDIATGGGNDIIEMGIPSDGNDTIDGGDGIDTLDYSRIDLPLFTEANGGLRITLDGGLATGRTAAAVAMFGRDQIANVENVIGGNLSDLILGDELANRLDGRGGNDTLAGLAGKDVLIGGLGNDSLTGGLDRDTLSGGAGADRFVFFSSDTGITRATRDVILDFEQGSDKIDLRGFDARADMTGEQDFTFAGTVTTSAAGTVRFVTEGENTVIQLNTTGTSTAEATILLHGLYTLTAADFLLV